MNVFLGLGLPWTAAAVSLGDRGASRVGRALFLEPGRLAQNHLKLTANSKFAPENWPF